MGVQFLFWPDESPAKTPPSLRCRGKEKTGLRRFPLANPFLNVVALYHPQKYTIMDEVVYNNGKVGGTPHSCRAERQILSLDLSDLLG